ncbi:hypothetical protein K0B96_11190 [Horticoccus luteus]|uniref:LPS export ABC transporter protein LptC n=1 Tax=Horticoccus luteus TaxID=2862869 RepID=A0A8F9TUM6_9BACT|nr:hypothetical protein [Horticoccus luteus]QYM77882.1 hypothetical protein K0B96_11190 [Horticoccus luteus]
MKPHFHPPLRALMLGAILSGLAIAAHAQLPAADAPALNFSLPAFTPEGYRSFLLRASSASFAGPKEIELRNANLTVFNGDAANTVETVILAPVARFFTERNLASGPGSVRLIRDDMEVTGQEWRYDHAHKTVFIAKDVRVIFHAALPDLIQ